MAKKTNKKSVKQKTRDAAAIAARRHPKNETDSVIAVVPNQESNDLLDAANMNKPSDQAAADATINTQSADDAVIVATDDPPPIVSYMDGTDVEEVIDTADDPIPADSAWQPDDVQPTPTNEELALKMAAEAAVQDIVPFEQRLSEFCIGLRDSTDNVLKSSLNAVVNGWIAFGVWTERRVDALYLWGDQQNKKLDAQLKIWFPKPDLITKAHLDETLKEAFVELADVLSGSYKELHETNIRLSKRIEQLEKAVRGDAPRTVSLDKLTDLIEAVRKGENTKVTTMTAALSGATLKAAKEAVTAKDQPVVN